MDEKKLVHAPHVGAKPVKAKPNHDREKTYEAPNPPARDEKAAEALPENTTRHKVEEEMPEATEKVKRRL